MTLPAYIPDYVSAPLELAVSPTDVLYGSHIRGTKLVHSLPLEPGTSGTGDAFCSDVLLLYCAFLNLECLILFFHKNLCYQLSCKFTNFRTNLFNAYLFEI